MRKINNLKREEIIQLHSQIQEERAQTQQELTKLRTVVIDYEKKIEELTILLNNSKPIERSFEVDSFKSSYNYQNSPNSVEVFERRFESNKKGHYLVIST